MVRASAWVCASMPNKSATKPSRCGPISTIRSDSSRAVRLSGLARAASSRWCRARSWAARLSRNLRSSLISPSRDIRSTNEKPSRMESEVVTAADHLLPRVPAGCPDAAEELGQTAMGHMVPRFRMASGCHSRRIEATCYGLLKSVLPGARCCFRSEPCPQDSALRLGHETGNIAFFTLKSLQVAPFRIEARDFRLDTGMLRS